MIRSRLYGHTEATFIRAPPAASSLPKGSVGAVINAVIYILVLRRGSGHSKGGGGYLDLAEGVPRL